MPMPLLASMPMPFTHAKWAPRPRSRRLFRVAPTGEDLLQEAADALVRFGRPGLRQRRCPLQVRALPLYRLRLLPAQTWGLRRQTSRRRYRQMQFCKFCEHGTSARISTHACSLSYKDLRQLSSRKLFGKESGFWGSLRAPLRPLLPTVDMN